MARSLILFVILLGTKIYAQTTATIKLSDPCVDLRGRWQLGTDGSGMLDWPGTGFTVAVNGGSGLRLIINASVPVRFKTRDLVGSVPESVSIAWPGDALVTLAAGFGARANHTFGKGNQTAASAPSSLPPSRLAAAVQMLSTSATRASAASTSLQAPS